MLLLLVQCVCRFCCSLFIAVVVAAAAGRLPIALCAWRQTPWCSTCLDICTSRRRNSSFSGLSPLCMRCCSRRGCLPRGPLPLPHGLREQHFLPWSVPACLLSWGSLVSSVSVRNCMFHILCIRRAPPYSSVCLGRRVSASLCLPVSLSWCVFLGRSQSTTSGVCLFATACSRVCVFVRVPACVHDLVSD